VRIEMADQDNSMATAAPDDDAEATTAGAADEEDAAGTGVNLQKAYSKLNSSITALFDGLGVRRSATIPHVKGEQMHEHIGAIAKVLPSIGGVTANFLTATHTQHDPTGGATVAHPSHKLREAIIPQDSKEAKGAISAVRTFVNKVGSLVGETPEVQKAKSQVQLIATHDMAGMTAFDAGAALISIPHPLIQLVARMHSGTKPGGHAPHLRAPGGQIPPESQSQPVGEAQAVAQVPEGQETASAAPGAPQTAPQGAPQAAAPVAA
jgi:hypothetical protein